jgi:tripartite-type tricarboxylate transporter receptor subunit TctC
VKRQFISLIAIPAGMALAAITSCAFAQDYPTKPVHLVVSFVPGGPTDVIGRLLAQTLSERFGSSFVVENRGGAGGNIAAHYVAGAPPDGYTLLVTTSALAVNQTLYKDPGYQVLRDFTPIALVALSPNVFVTAPSTPANSLKEFLRDSKDQHITYATAGIGATPHLSGYQLLHLFAELDAVDVPYQGAAPAIAAVMGEHVTLGSVTFAPALALIKAGKLKALAITSLQRSDELPSLPTVAESGFPGFESYTWVALLGPPNMPASIVTRINAAINDALRTSEVRTNLASQGFDVKPGTPAEFATYLGQEVVKWGDLVKQTGITLQ